MGNLKMLKAPKKPKASASAATMKKYLERVDAIAAENARRVKENNERESLYKKIQGLSGVPMKRTTARRKSSSLSGTKKRKGGKRKR
jgi:hypothetical protein